MLDLSSDLSAPNESDDDDIQIIEASSSASTLKKKVAKGKGKAVAKQSDDDSEEYGDDGIVEEESEEDVEKIRSLARALGKKGASFAVVVQGRSKKGAASAKSKGKEKKLVAAVDGGSAAGSDVKMPAWLAEDNEEEGSDDEGGGEGADAGMSNNKWGKTTLKNPPRTGAVIPKDLKIKMKKMSKVRLALRCSASLRRD